MFDPRCDSDSLYHQCGKVLMKGVICLQLSEVATLRQAQRKQGGPYPMRVKGLKAVLASYLPSEAQLGVQRIKDQGKSLFAPELGGRQVPAAYIQLYQVGPSCNVYLCHVEGKGFICQQIPNVHQKIPHAGILSLRTGPCCPRSLPTAARMWCTLSYSRSACTNHSTGSLRTGCSRSRLGVLMSAWRAFRPRKEGGNRKTWPQGDREPAVASVA